MGKQPLCKITGKILAVLCEQMEITFYQLIGVAQTDVELMTHWHIGGLVFLP